jgi:hypothetical protein
MTEREDTRGTIARRTLIGAIGFASLGGIAAGALGLTGRGARRCDGPPSQRP